MARIELAPEVFEDFDRIFEHVAQFDVGTAASRIEAIVQAVQVLATSPWIGRLESGENRQNRELVIGRGTRGYLALYRYVPEMDTVFLLAVRSQRESGYKHGT